MPPTSQPPPEATSTETPQRRLALELRFWIDYTMSRPTETNLTRLRQLVRENPRGWASAHVRHNLGERRVSWVEAQIKEVNP
jgi:DNA mismatch repair protein MutH